MALDPVTAALIATAITSLVGLLATIAGFIFTYLRSEQSRRNDREDRRELAAKEKEDRRELAAKEKEDRERTNAIRVEQLLKLQQAIDENTTKTEEVGGKADSAYKEANSVNLKIADLHKENSALHEEIRDLLKQREAAEKQPDQLKEPAQVVIVGSEIDVPVVINAATGKT